MARSPQRPTLAEISSEAGVSVATVSRVLNGKPGVAAALRRRVQSILTENGYVRGSDSNAAPLVGVVVPDLTNPIFGLFADAIEAQLAVHGYNAVLSCIRTSGDETEFAEMLLRENAEGVIIIAGTNNFALHERSDLLDLQQRGLRIVLVNGPANGVPAPSLTTDFEHALGLAFSHLRTLGHTAIGFAAGPAESSSSALQIGAFTRLADTTGVHGELFVTPYSVEGERSPRGISSSVP
ncbi:LacI family DNA-binding transcriptional regulator [Microbacterium sp. Y-01]|uniref:LacI family DNA-binding transcriptional regulator n=1 Tax=Microbacterium sp. Y-01 TaxID=2048898 RepID=UPI000F5DC7C8